MKELIQNIVQWGVDRGLNKVGHLAQAKYTLKETAELLDAYADGDTDKISDAIGDILVTLIVGASNKESVLKNFNSFLCKEEFSEEYGVNGVFLEEYRELIHSENVLMHRIKCDDVEVFEYAECVSNLHEIICNFNEEFNMCMSLKDCLQLAYDEIKNRKGKLVNGQFIKEEKA